MVEAAMALPILILIVFSMVMLMMHHYEKHQSQIDLHKQLIDSWDTSTAIFDIEKKTTETSTRIGGAVDLMMTNEQVSRIYLFRPSQCIRLGELVSFDEE